MRSHLLLYIFKHIAKSSFKYPPFFSLNEVKFLIFPPKLRKKNDFTHRSSFLYSLTFYPLWVLSPWKEEHKVYNWNHFGNERTGRLQLERLRSRNAHTQRQVYMWGHTKRHRGLQSRVKQRDGQIQKLYMLLNRPQSKSIV